MKRAWIETVIALAVAFLLQIAVAPQIAVFGVTPNLLLLVAVTLALVEGPTAGSVAGFAAGLLFDMLATTPIGAWALVLSVVGYVAGSLSTNLFAEGWLLPVTVAGISALTAELAFMLVVTVLGMGSPFGDTLVHVVLPRAVYNTVLALFVFPWLARLLRREQPMQSFRRLA